MISKTVLITGGASGIGLAMVKKFAGAGSEVYFIDTNHTEGSKIEKEATGNGFQVKFLEADITDFPQLEKLIQTIPGKIETTTGEDFDRLYQVNVKGMFNCIKACIPKLKENGGGSILNMCSVAATIGIPDRFAYSMTKGAALSMTLSVARDYVADGIRCNCLSPGRVHTPFVDGFLAKSYPGQEAEMFAKLAASQPIGRMGTPEEIAEMAFFISSDAGTFITGSNFNIDGGFMGLKM